ncbi:MAG: HlyD family efflux transporter periplasmic adaptor subunit [Dysgonamonadaceae bacterium]|jgi:HlyD family secretion protein|nr:HlyD family efflux transporter periplasmic adaptor subunit [Dysgonamonadaceae bacterium]
MDKKIPVSERRKALRKQIIKYGIISAVIIVSFLFFIRFIRPSVHYKDIIVSEIDKGSIEVSINASGKIVPMTEEIIITPINSRILEVYKNPGEKVNKGDAILQLELASIETEYKQKLDEREMKKSKLTQLEVNSNNRISELKMQRQIKEMQLKQMHTELKNEHYLDSIGASTSDKIRQAELNYEVAKLELEQLTNKISNEDKNIDAEIKVQQLDLSIFDKSLTETGRLLKDARILSPLDATLTFVNNEIGSQVGAGSQIAIVSDLSHFKVNAEAADNYANYIEAGGKAIVKIGDSDLEGTILNVIPSSKNGVINFTVILKNPDNPKLRSGLKADVYVMIGIKDDVLRIENGAYFSGKNAYHLWVIKGDKAVLHNVRLGESNFDYVEVIGGLQEGDKVIISGIPDDFNHAKEIKINN